MHRLVGMHAYLHRLFLMNAIDDFTGLMWEFGLRVGIWFLTSSDETRKIV
jgi:hypothetical protein